MYAIENLFVATRLYIDNCFSLLKFFKQKRPQVITCGLDNIIIYKVRSYPYCHELLIATTNLYLKLVSSFLVFLLCKYKNVN